MNIEIKSMIVSTSFLFFHFGLVLTAFGKMQNFKVNAQLKWFQLKIRLMTSSIGCFLSFNNVSNVIIAKVDHKYLFVNCLFFYKKLSLNTS